MAPVWFRPRRYGYGVKPISWQGWALIAAFLAIVLVLWLTLIGFEEPAERSGSATGVFFLSVIAVAGVFWIVAKRTTLGKWRWRWGEEDE